MGKPDSVFGLELRTLVDASLRQYSNKLRENSPRFASLAQRVEPGISRSYYGSRLVPRP